MWENCLSKEKWSSAWPKTYACISQIKNISILLLGEKPNSPASSTAGGLMWFKHHCQPGPCPSYALVGLFKVSWEFLLSQPSRFLWYLSTVDISYNPRQRVKQVIFAINKSSLCAGWDFHCLPLLEDISDNLRKWLMNITLINHVRLGTTQTKCLPSSSLVLATTSRILAYFPCTSQWKDINFKKKTSHFKFTPENFSKEHLNHDLNYDH